MKASRCAVVVALALCIGAHPALAVQIGKLRLDPLLEVEVFTGYPSIDGDPRGLGTVGVAVHNHGAPRRVEILLAGAVSAGREISVPGGETVRAFFYLPMISRLATLAPLDLTVVDRKSGASAHTLVAPFTLRHRRDKGYSLARIDVIDTAVNVKDPWVDVGILSPGGSLPDDWRGLTGIHVLLVGQRTLRDSASWWPVVAPWVAMGGSLVVVRDGIDAVELPDLPFAESASMAVRGVGNGRVAIVEPAAVATIDAQFRFAREIVPMAVNEKLSSSVVAKKLGIVAGARWPILLVLIGYAALVGPLGWSFLERQRPFAYLASVFGLAGLFSIFLMASSLWLDGIFPLALTRSVRFLDQVAAAEILFDEAFVYAPSPWGDTALRAGPSTSFLVGAGDDLGAREARLEYVAQGEVLDGVVPARLPALVGRRALHASRRRLIIDATDGIRVENQLGADVTRLQVWHDGRMFVLRDLRRGATARATALSALSNTGRCPDFFTADPLLREGLLVESLPLSERICAGGLGSRFYVAELADDPDPIVAGARRPNAGLHAVLGVYE